MGRPATGRKCLGDKDLAERRQNTWGDAIFAHELVSIILVVTLICKVFIHLCYSISKRLKCNLSCKVI